MTNSFRTVALLTCALTGLTASMAHANEFNCLSTDTCLSVGQITAEHCHEEQNDRLIASNDFADNVVTFLSVHGSSIEQVNDDISSMAAIFDSWNRYDFSDHGSATRAYWICG